MHAENSFAMFYAAIFTKRMATEMIIAAIFQWLFGALWYGVIVRNSWKKLVGIPEGVKPKNRIFGLIASLLACLMLSFALVHLVLWTGLTTFTAGARIGILCWVGFIAPPLLAQHIFENRRVNLFAINACYWLLAMVLAGGIIAGLH